MGTLNNPEATPKSSTRGPDGAVAGRRPRPSTSTAADTVLAVVSRTSASGSSVNAQRPTGVAARAPPARSPIERRSLSRAAARMPLALTTSCNMSTMGTTVAGVPRRLSSGTAAMLNPKPV